MVHIAGTVAVRHKQNIHFGKFSPSFHLPLPLSQICSNSLSKVCRIRTDISDHVHNGGSWVGAPACHHLGHLRRGYLGCLYLVVKLSLLNGLNWRIRIVKFDADPRIDQFYLGCLRRLNSLIVCYRNCWSLSRNCEQGFEFCDHSETKVIL